MASGLPGAFFKYKTYGKESVWPETYEEACRVVAQLFSITEFKLVIRFTNGIVMPITGQKKWQEVTDQAREGVKKGYGFNNRAVQINVLLEDEPSSPASM